MDPALAPNRATPWLAVEDRRATRVHLGLPVTIARDGPAAAPAMMIDVSRFGCRLTGAPRQTVGSLVTIHVKHFTSLEGWVAWDEAGVSGLDFAHPVPEPIVSHLASFTR